MPNEIGPNENGGNNQSPSQTQNTEVFNPPKPTQKDKLMVLLRVFLMLFFEVALPIALFYILEKHMKQVWALVISGIPPFLVVIIGFISKRKVDVLGVVIILGFIVSASVAGLQDDPKLYLLQDSTISGAVGLIYLITLIPIKIGSYQLRPIIYYFARDMMTGGAFGSSKSKQEGSEGSRNGENEIELWEKYWKIYPVFRHGFYVLTIVWGIGLIIRVPLNILVILKSDTVDRAVYLTNIVNYSNLSLLIAFNIIYSSIFKKKCKKIIGEGERAAAAAAATETNV